MYASNAGKSGGEYYTPQEVSELLTRIALVGKTDVNKVYDPACGSGSLLLNFAKILGKENVRVTITPCLSMTHAFPLPGCLPQNRKPTLRLSCTALHGLRQTERRLLSVSPACFTGAARSRKSANIL